MWGVELHATSGQLRAYDWAGTIFADMRAIPNNLGVPDEHGNWVRIPRTVCENKLRSFFRGDELLPYNIGDFSEYIPDADDCTGNAEILSDERKN